MVRIDDIDGRRGEAELTTINGIELMDRNTIEM